MENFIHIALSQRTDSFGWVISAQHGSWFSFAGSIRSQAGKWRLLRLAAGANAQQSLFVG